MRTYLFSSLALTFIATAFSVQTTQAQNTSPYWSLAGNSNASSTAKLGTTNADPLNLVTSNLTRVRIAIDGKVGIGTTNPQQRLHVEGLANQAIFVNTTALGSSSGSGMIGSAKALPTAANQRLGYFLVGSRGGAENGYNGAGMVGYSDGAWSAGSSHPTYLAFETAPSGSATRVERMRIGSNGNVGIGTTTPSYKLEVDGGSNGAIYGNSTYLGVLGYGGSYGVYGYGTTTTGYGVYGYGGTGVFGGSNNSAYGVYGSSSSTYSSNGSSGVYGTGYYGVHGVGSSGYGVYGEGYYDGGYFVGSSSYSSSYGVYSYGKYIGTYGYGGTYGLYGYGSTYGVYGSTGSGGYAGYFNGTVYATTYTGSDRKLKKNIVDFTSAMDILGKLQPKSYEFRQDGDYKLMNLPEGKHYGLIAQDLEQVLPGLVKDTKFDVALAKQSQTKQEAGKAPAQEQAQSIDFKAVNYTELIPIMVKGMQEQQAKIERLEALVNKLMENRGGTVTSNVLSQATPNPSSGTTRISYTLPTGVSHAQLLVTDAAGKTIRALSLNGSGNVDLNTTSFSSGMYNYSLMIEGNIVETKKLVVAR